MPEAPWTRQRRTRAGRRRILPPSQARVEQPLPWIAAQMKRNFKCVIKFVTSLRGIMKTPSLTPNKQNVILFFFIAGYSMITNCTRNKKTYLMGIAGLGGSWSGSIGDGGGDHTAQDRQTQRKHIYSRFSSSFFLLQRVFFCYSIVNVKLKLKRGE